MIIRDGPDIKLAGYPAPKLYRISGGISGQLDILPDIGPDNQLNRISSSRIYGQPDVWQDDKCDIQLDTGYQKKPDIWSIPNVPLPFSFYVYVFVLNV